EPRHFVQVEIHRGEHFLDAREREAAARKHALDARFGEAQAARELGVGQSLRTHAFLERLDEAAGRPHATYGIRLGHLLRCCCSVAGCERKIGTKEEAMM